MGGACQACSFDQESLYPKEVKLLKLHKDVGVSPHKQSGLSSINHMMSRLDSFSDEFYTKNYNLLDLEQNSCSAKAKRQDSTQFSPFQLNSPSDLQLDLEFRSPRRKQGLNRQLKNFLKQPKPSCKECLNREELRALINEKCKFRARSQCSSSNQRSSEGTEGGMKRSSLPLKGILKVTSQDSIQQLQIHSRKAKILFALGKQVRFIDGKCRRQIRQGKKCSSEVLFN